MKKPAKFVVIVLVLLLELAWAAWPRFGHGAVVDEPYRHAERMAAMSAWLNHETPETKAAFDAEIELLDKHMALKTVAILIGGLAFNAVGIYLFWRNATTKTTD